MGFRFTPELPETDAGFLTRALELGRRGWGGVHPNPMVGCVLVKDGRIVGEGWHEVYGGPHAEVQALRAAGPGAEGATAFVSLEPCRHQGKTPACTVALKQAGVARVVFAAADPGVESGGGRAILQAAGIPVSGPHLTAADAARENPAFFHSFSSDRSWVAIKLATSMDGAINAAGSERTLLTGAETRCEVHRLRSGFDAVMIGARTARIDDPLLTVREVDAPRGQPVRIVLDSAASLASGSRLVRSAGGLAATDATIPGDSGGSGDSHRTERSGSSGLSEGPHTLDGLGVADDDDGDAASTRGPVWVFCAQDADEGEVERLEAAGVRVHPVPRAGLGESGSTAHGLDLSVVLRECRELGVQSILCEGGGELARALIRGGHARRLHLFQAPVCLGADALPGLDAETGSGWTPIADPVAHGADIHLVLERA